MSTNTNWTGPTHSAAIERNPREPAATKHFAAFENDFFQQGDDSASVAVEVEQFDDLDEAGQSKHFLLSRTSLIIAGSCAAVLACVALWRSGSRPSELAAAPAPPMTIRAVQPVIAVPIPAPVAVLTKPAPAEPVAEHASATPAAKPEIEPAPTVAPAAVPTGRSAGEPPCAQAEQQPNRTARAVAVPAVVPPTAVPATPVEADAETLRAAVPTGPTAPDDVQSRCKQAIGNKRNKEILAACPIAFAADSGRADIAVALAKIEVDRGRFAQAYAWGKKAIVGNPDLADAYVFIGAAEQNAGHGKAAKEAYKQYLRLAPSGRYAADMRAIVTSL